jgi:hypothetical protein
MLLCFLLSLLFCFSTFPASLLFCFCASAPFYFYLFLSSVYVFASASSLFLHVYACRHILQLACLIYAWLVLTPLVCGDLAKQLALLDHLACLRLPPYFTTCMFNLCLACFYAIGKW